MEKYKRFIIVVMDSLGIGNAKDANLFSQEGKPDTGANTFNHIAEKYPDMNIPNLKSLGINDLVPSLNGSKTDHLHSYTIALNESSNGKDTMTGHWEMMGIYTTVPFQTFTDTGFPKELVVELERKTGHKIIGNYSSSGTKILEELGEEQMRDNSLILYTSADSVLQFAAHEEVTGVKELYRCCEIARELCMDPKYFVGRVIARPFVGKDKTSFKRTANRHDYAVSPSEATVMNILKDNGFETSCIGKINDIFNGSGVTKTQKTVSNYDGMEKLIAEIKNTDYEGLCFVNLVEFDSEFGHRRNVEGYKNSIEQFDEQLKTLMDVMKDDDLLMITADHGNDPTWIGSDHTREQVPLIVFSKKIQDGKYIGEIDSFGSIGASILKNFGLKMPKTLIGNPISKLF